MNKSALPFIVNTPDSNRNKSIISYDISESEASKSKTIDSLLPKKTLPKFQLTSPIGPEPIKDFAPAAIKKKKDSVKVEIKKEKVIKTTPIAQEKIDSLNKKQVGITNVYPSPDSIVKGDSVKQASNSLVKPIAKPAVIAKNYTKSLFESNLLAAHQIEPKIKTVAHSDWVTGVLLFVVAIGCILNISYRSRFRQLFNAFLSNRFVGQIVREENVMFQRISIFLTLLFLFVTSLFIFQISRFYAFPLTTAGSFTTYSVIVIALLSFYFIKISTFNFLGFLLKIEKEMKEYVFTIFLYNHFVGVGLIPIVVLLAFVPNLPQKGIILTGLTFFVVAFLVRTLRSYGNVSGSTRFSIFYLFLYLCALEILPLVVITKLLIDIV
mgnify:CR=1 FL=1